MASPRRPLTPINPTRVGRRLLIGHCCRWSAVAVIPRMIALLFVGRGVCRSLPMALPPPHGAAIEAMSGMGEGPRELLFSTAKTDSEEVLVAVRDSGPGLAPESVDRLFGSFYTTKPVGLGMGLSICRSIIEAHHGRLWATANIPRGAVFQFTLPRYSYGEKEDR